MQCFKRSHAIKPLPTLSIGQMHLAFFVMPCLREAPPIVDRVPIATESNPIVPPSMECRSCEKLCFFL